MKKIIAILTIILFTTISAQALDLAAGRMQGLIGEKNNGYVTALKETLEAKNLAAEVNEKRKAEYTRISKENGQPVDVVAKIAAEQIINKLPSGAKYQDGSGAWKSK